MKRIGFSFVLALGVFGLAETLDAPQALAQSSTTGVVRGVIVDKATKDAVIGATVSISGPALQGQQAEITDDNGGFTIASLPPGNYVLTVFYGTQQFSRPNVLIEVGKQAFVRVPIDTSIQTTEVIELEGRTPIVDQGSTKTGTTITEDYTRNIPVGRTFGAVLGTAAGTQGDQYGVSFSGSTSSESTFIVEGINTTDTAFGGQSSNLPNEFVEETEVIAGGYNAEFGRSTGGVINVVTKQGSNKFKGSIFAYYTPGTLVAEGTPILREGSSIGTESNLNYATDLGFEVGGPIIKDKLWFHVGANPSFSKTIVDRITSSQVDENQDGEVDIDPETDLLVTREVGRNPYSRTLKTAFFTAKVNGAVSENHQFQISAFGNPRSADRDFYRTTANRSASIYRFDDGAYDAAIKWTSKFNENKTQVDLVGGFHRGFENQLPYFADGDQPLVAFAPTPGRAGSTTAVTHTLSEFKNFEGNLAAPGCDDNTSNDEYPMIDNCPVLGYGTGGVGFLEERDNDRLSGQLSITQRVNLLGHHTFKGGVDYELTTYNSHRGYTGDAIWLESFSLGGEVLWRKRTLLVFDDAGDYTCVGGLETCSESSGGINADTSNKNLGAYIQDSWQIRPNLTLNAGLRWENQTGGVAKFLQGTLSPEGEVIPENAYELKNMLAPRVGIIFDPTQEGRAKLFGHWGRFYENVPMDINVRAFGGEIINFARIRTSTAFENACPAAINATTAAELEMCPFNNRSHSQSGGGTEYVAKTTKGQYIDEIILGGEYEVMADFKVGLNYVHRELPRVIEDISTDGGTTYIIGNPGEDFSEEAADLRAQAEANRMDGDPSNDDIADLADARAGVLDTMNTVDKPVRNYDGVQLTANHRFSKNAMLLGSYTYSRTKGNFPGLFSTETGQLDPNLTSLYDLPDLLANRNGPLGLDRPHLLKVDGFYMFDLKKAGLVVLGASFRGQSGIAHNTLGSHYAYGPQEAYILPRGSANRSPFVWTTDVKATYGRKISKAQQIEVFVDVFNLFNRQDETDSDEAYTFNNMNPIVGGDLSDLPHSKSLDGDGLEQNSTPVLNKNYGKLNARQGARSVRFGLRYTF